MMGNTRSLLIDVGGKPAFSTLPLLQEHSSAWKVKGSADAYGGKIGNYWNVGSLV